MARETQEIHTDQKLKWSWITLNSKNVEDLYVFFGALKSAYKQVGLRTYKWCPLRCAIQTGKVWHISRFRAPTTGRYISQLAQDIHERMYREKITWRDLVRCARVELNVRFKRQWTVHHIPESPFGLLPCAPPRISPSLSHCITHIFTPFSFFYLPNTSAIYNTCVANFHPHKDRQKLAPRILFCQHTKYLLSHMMYVVLYIWTCTEIAIEWVFTFAMEKMAGACYVFWWEQFRALPQTYLISSVIWLMQMFLNVWERGV